MTEAAVIIGNLLGSALTLPFDYLKVQSQIGPGNANYSHSKFTGIQVVATRTVANLVTRGLLTNIISSPENKYLNASLVVVVGTLMTPLDNILVKMQTKHLSPVAKLNSASEAYAYASSTGLLRGLDANFFKISAFTVGALSVSGLNLGPSDDVFAGICTYSIAATVGTVLSLPFDNTRVNLQKCVADSNAPSASFIEVLNGTYKSQGLLSLYRGFLPAVGRNIVAFTIAYVFTKTVAEE